MNFEEILNITTNIGMCFAGRALGGCAFNMKGRDEIEEVAPKMVKQIIREAHKTYDSYYV